MGHYARGTHTVIPVQECPVHPERANRIAFALRDELRRSRIAAAGPDLRGLARHVLVRTTRDGREAVAALVATRDDPASSGRCGPCCGGLARPAGARAEPPRPARSVPGRARDASHRRVGPREGRRPRPRVPGLAHRLLPDQRRRRPRAAAARERSLPGSGHGPRPLQRQRSVRASPRDARAARDGRGREPEGGSRRGAESKTNGVGEQQLRDPGAPRSSVRSRDSHREPSTRSFFTRHATVARRRSCAPSSAGCVPGGPSWSPCNPEALARELPVAARAGYRVRSVEPVDMFPTRPTSRPSPLEREGRSISRHSRAAARPASARPRRRSTVLTLTNSRMPYADSSRP